jgi:hypothetical protein
MGRKIELTPEIKEKLLGLAPFNPTIPFEFTPDAFTKQVLPADMTPVFSILSMTKGEEEELRKIHSSAVPSDEKYKNFLRKKVIGWVNLFDVATGDEIDFEADPVGGCTLAAFEKLSSWIVLTLAGKIHYISAMGALEKKSLG